MRVVQGPESYGLSGAIVAARYIFTSLFFVDTAVLRPFDNGFTLAEVPNNRIENCLLLSGLKEWCEYFTTVSVNQLKRTLVTLNLYNFAITVRSVTKGISADSTDGHN